MTRSLILGATALALSAGAASAQTVYVAPGYVAPAYVAPAPAYLAPPVYEIPAPVYVAPPVVHHYYAPRGAVSVAAPLYDYAPAYSETIIEPDW